MAVRRAASLPLAFPGHPRLSMLQCSYDVDARHRRQVDAVCAGLTALAGHDEFAREPSFIRRIFESDS